MVIIVFPPFWIAPLCIFDIYLVETLAFSSVFAMQINRITTLLHIYVAGGLYGMDIFPRVSFSVLIMAEVGILEAYIRVILDILNENISILDADCCLWYKYMQI